MNTSQKNLLIIGAGAIGGTLAGILVREGYCVDLICKYPETAQKVNTEGLSVIHPSGNFQAVMPAYAHISDCDPHKKYDYVFIATKAGELEAVARNVLPLLHEESRVVSLQNGICEEQLARVVGPQRTVGCVVGYGATMHGPAEVEMTSHGEFIIGYLNGHRDLHLEYLKDVMHSVVPTEITDQMLAELYSKLIINSCITTLGAVCGLLLGDMLKKRHIRELFIEIIREAMALAETMQLKVPAYAGKFDYYRFLSWPEWRRHAFIRLFGMKYRKLKSSSLQSLERGKKTEIDFFNGYIATRGIALNVSVPLNQQLTDMVKSIEQGKLIISPDNFQESFFQQYYNRKSL